MFPTDPRAAIARMPYLLDHEPREVLMVAGFDAEGVLHHRGIFPLEGHRPLDEPLLDSSLWPNDITYVATVAYSSMARVDLRPLVDAWGYRGRTTVAAAWAGPTGWRSYLCTVGDCCTHGEHPYPSNDPVHGTFDPLQDRAKPLINWRRASWNDWIHAIGDVASGANVDPPMLETLSISLHDIPVRDALLAHSADPAGQVRPAIQQILTAVSLRSTPGSAIPAHTCLAAMHYLADETLEARRLIRRILDCEDYSLAELLHNGLEMRAPASLLARSFAHFTPQQLLAA